MNFSEESLTVAHMLLTATSSQRTYLTARQQTESQIRCRSDMEHKPENVCIYNSMCVCHNHEQLFNGNIEEDIVCSWATMENCKYYIPKKE